MSGETFDVDLSDKSWAIFGLRRSGKSWLTKKIMDTTDSHFIYDPMREHEGYHHYRPKDRDSVEELDEVIRKMVIPWRPALCVIDEANKYVQPKPTPLPKGIADLVDFCGHWGISVGYIARRPVQFHTDIVELADYLFLFRLTGRNDYRYLEDLHVGLGDAVRALKKHHFVIYGDGEIVIHAPIDEPKHPFHSGRGQNGQRRQHSGTNGEQHQQVVG